MKKKIVIVSGFSGVGKGTVLDYVLKQHPEMELVTSYTTRPPRNQTDKYKFVSEEIFTNMKANGEFIEANLYAGNWYGTPKSEIKRIIDDKKIPILEIDQNGLQQILQSKEFTSEEIISVFIVIPAEELIWRLISRASESTPQILERFEASMEESKNLSNYDATIYNWKAEQAATELVGFVENKEGGEDFDCRQFRKEMQYWIEQLKGE